MKSADERFNEISHDCSICTRVKVDPPYAFMELELEDGTPTGDATATLTEEGMEKLIEYLRQTLDDFRAEVNENVDKGMRFSPRKTELHGFEVDFARKQGAICRIDEKTMRLHSFNMDWKVSGYPVVTVSFLAGKVFARFPPEKGKPITEGKVNVFDGERSPAEADHTVKAPEFDTIKDGEKEDGRTKL